MDLFNSAYEGIPPWDIGRPQREIIRLAEDGEVSGRVLDVGCGTGENALYLARQGFEVWGIDAAPAAIKKAKEKARKRGITVNFLVSDTLELQSLRTKFDTVIDCGLFHVLSDEERPIFAASLSSALFPGGKYFMLCFSEHEPGSFGPRRVTQAEIRATFGKGWKINYIREAEFETRFGPEGVKAWLSSISFLQNSSGTS
ncbi:MAG: methyltransferase domain-containing protein [Euryarchaeota archaeon]|nr:methyltransferase domain-containing protein [Euryarchaeota archaeon]MBU4138592.1 methyltransferase domain-containing protein [Euryarchaeota archaeon]